jgi:secreted trypsin-like serine protease
VAHDRIVGGDIAIRGAFPWQAMVVSIWNGQIVSYCGGALISKDYVLTAAQCVTE